METLSGANSAIGFTPRRKDVIVESKAEPKLLRDKRQGISLSNGKISRELQRFIFDAIDSIGFLEAVLLFHAQPSKSWTAETLAQELRNNPASTREYFRRLESLRLAREVAPGRDEFFYDPSAPGLAEVVAELEDAYRVQRHKIIELVYSPLKKARDFSDAFVIQSSGEKKDGRDG